MGCEFRPWLPRLQEGQAGGLTRLLVAMLKQFGLLDRTSKRDPQLPAFNPSAPRP